MDTLKGGTYFDPPDSLDSEKGRLEAETEPLHPEASHVQPARTCGFRSIVKRHWVAIGAVVLTWFAFSFTMRVLHRPRLNQTSQWHWAGEDAGPHGPSDESRDEDRVKCVVATNWTTYYDPPTWTEEHPFGAETEFSLPLDADALYLISRGPFQHGQVNIEQSTDVVDTVNVRVRVAYDEDEVLEHATVCQLQRENADYGVGIFTPRWTPHLPRPPPQKPRYGLEFDVTLTLPAGKEGPLFVKKLETKLPDYSQNVADLQKSVLFEYLNLMSVNGQLTVESVTSDTGKFSLLNGGIEGHFNALSSLDLRTLNGHITSTVNLLHSSGADSSNLTMHTMNGQIDAEVSLTSEALIGGEFQVAAQSGHGEIGLKFADTPVNSVLRCDAETTVGKVEIELDSAFEGTYSLRSVLGKKLVSQHAVEDPAGRGRQRVVTQKEGAGHVEGEVKWVESDGSSSENEGVIVVKAITASVELVV